MLRLLTGLAWSEIFGPALPIVPVADIDEAIKYVNEQYVLVLVIGSSLITNYQRSSLGALRLREGCKSQEEGPWKYSEWWLPSQRCCNSSGRFVFTVSSHTPQLTYPQLMVFRSVVSDLVDVCLPFFQSHICSYLVRRCTNREIRFWHFHSSPIYSGHPVLVSAFPHIYTIHADTSYRVDMILGFRFPPYTVRNLFTISKH